MQSNWLPAAIRGHWLAIDPGTTESGYVFLDKEGKIAGSGIEPNREILKIVGPHKGPLAIEMIASYGMPVGREVFETCVWIGRYMEHYFDAEAVRLIYRKDVKKHICFNAQAKDPNIRQALIDKLGPPGTKKEPGGTYGVKSHAWAALAVAVTARETLA